MIRIIFTSIALLLLSILPAEAQNWKWAQRHGGDSIQASGGWGTISVPFQDRRFGWNSVIDIATDGQNNVYAVSHVLGKDLDLNGLPLTGWGKSDILLSSYTCDGALRWSKVIGSNQDSDVVVGVRCDETGVIVSGTTSSNFAFGSTGSHFSTDTVTGSTAKNFFLAKWHADGTFLWLRMPQPNSISPQSVRNSRLIDMDATPLGDTVFMFCYLAPGIYAGGVFNVPASGAYVLKYTNTGVFAGGLVLPYQQLVQDGLLWSRWCYNYPLKQFVVSGFAFPGGVTTLNIAGTHLTHSLGYLASFDAITGGLNYLLTDTSGKVTFTRKVAIGRNGDIYLSGNAKAGAIFHGVSFPNPLAVTVPSGGYKNGYAPFVMRLNGMTGSPIWTTKSQATSALGLNISLGKRDLLLTGQYSGTLQFPTGSISNNPTVDSGDAFTAFLDTATGVVRQLSTIKAKGGDLPLIFNAVVPDRKGSFICGGSFNDTLKLGTKALVEKPHPANIDPFRVKFYDAWIGKFGYNNCNCNITANYRIVSRYGTVGFFAYNGSMNIDSLVWDWGDGTRNKYINNFTATISHNYATTGRYDVCVTAYNDTCNNSQFCGTVPLAVAGAVLEDVRVYPSPATQDVYIEGLSGGSARIVSVTGQMLLDVDINSDKQAISVGHLPAGYYMVLLRDKTGQTGQQHFLKE